MNQRIVGVVIRRDDANYEERPVDYWSGGGVVSIANELLGCKEVGDSFFFAGRQWLVIEQCFVLDGYECMLDTPAAHRFLMWRLGYDTALRLWAIGLRGMGRISQMTELGQMYAEDIRVNP